MRQTRTHAHARAWERNILPTINGRQKKRKEERDKKLAERRPPAATKEEKTRREIKQCFLYQQRRGGRPRESQRASVSRPEAPRLRSPSHSSLLPAVSFFFHSSHLLYLPPPPPKKRVTLGHYLHSFNPTLLTLKMQSNSQLLCCCIKRNQRIKATSFQPERKEGADPTTPAGSRLSDRSVFCRESATSL